MPALFLLYESASGYALLEAHGLDAIGGSTPAVQESVTDLDRFGKVRRIEDKKEERREKKREMPPPSKCLMPWPAFLLRVACSFHQETTYRLPAMETMSRFFCCKGTRRTRKASEGFRRRPALRIEMRVEGKKS